MRDYLVCRERDPRFMNESDRTCVSKLAQILSAGRAAECQLRILLNLDVDGLPYCDSGDQDDIDRLSASLFPTDTEAAYSWRESSYETAENIVIENWSRVEALANALMLGGALSGDEAEQLLRND